ncbi:MAG: arylesterase [Gemmatimonadetes bacterium]|nr:arylesterase [Gemmatimonadota bacterium]
MSMGRMIHAGAMLFLLAACARSDRPPALGRPSGTHGADPRAGDLSSRPTILFLGTSLTAGLGVDPGEAYPALIQRRLDSLALRWRVINAGLSGETSAGARRRIEWLLEPGVEILVLETGANDGLRGQGLDSTRANLEAIVARARASDPTMRIVLVGMEVPPNLGPRYAARFRALFRDLAERNGLTLIPFLLEGVGGVDSLNQADGIHPTAAGQVRVADNVWRVLERIVREAP